MTDIYQQLAKKLEDDSCASGSKIDLPILQRIYTPEEAELALQLDAVPETVEAIAERLGKSNIEMQQILESMIKKGQVGCIGERRLPFIGRMQDLYFLLPFYVRTCRQCAEEISAAADFCPHCGAESPLMTLDKRASSLIKVCLLILVLLFFAYLVYKALMGEAVFPLF